VSKTIVVVTPPGGAPSPARAGDTLSILNKQNGKWVLARDANMLSPSQSPTHDGQQGNPIFIGYTV
jgi:hypothetical protein